MKLSYKSPTKLPARFRDPLPRAVLHAPNRSLNMRMLPENRRVRFPEIFGWFAPNQLAAVERPPDEMLAHAVEVYGDWIRWQQTATDLSRPPDPTRPGWLVLMPHPWFKRWCLMEWCQVKDGRFKDGGEMAWKPTAIFAEPRRDGYLPADLNHPDGRYDDLRSKLGDYKVPDKEDFIDFEQATNRAKNQLAWDTVKRFIAEKERGEIEKEKQFRDWELDFHEHYAALETRRINQKFGSMQGLPFIPQTSLDKFDRDNESELYDVEQKDGYKVRRRKVREPEADRLMKRWEDTMQEFRALKELAGPDADLDGLYGTAQRTIDKQNRDAVIEAERAERKAAREAAKAEAKGQPVVESTSTQPVLPLPQGEKA